MPSWKRTSSRSVKVYRFALSSICHFVASSGRMVSESSRRMRGSRTLPMISSDAEPDGFAGSMSVFASHCAHVRTPPRFGGGVPVALVTAGAPLAVGTACEHAASPSAAAPRADRRRNSRRVLIARSRRSYIPGLHHPAPRFVAFTAPLVPDCSVCCVDIQDR